MNSRTRLRRLALLSAVLFAALLPGNASAATHDVSIVDFVYQPATLTIAPGDTVVWTNNDPEGHTVTADNGSFDSGILQPGADFSVDFPTAGEFPYFCEIHPGQEGTIVVQGNGGTTTTTTAPTTTTTTGPNRLPVAVNDAYTIGAGQTLTVPAPGVLANDSDPDGDPMTAGMPTNPSNGTLNLSTNGGFTYTPNAGFSGTDTFTYMAHDPFGGMTTATVRVTVTAAATTTTTMAPTTTTMAPTTTTMAPTTTTSMAPTTTTSMPPTTTTMAPTTTTMAPTTTTMAPTTTTMAPTTTTSMAPTTTTSPPPTTTTTSPPPTTTTTPPPGGPMQITPDARGNGNVLRITGTIACDVGNRFRIELHVSQGETHAQGVRTGQCRGGPQRFIAIVTVTSGPFFTSGPSHVDATAQIGNPGSRTIEDTFSASAEIDIAVRSGLLWAT